MKSCCTTKPSVYVTRLIPEKGLEIVKKSADTKIWEGELPPSRDIILDEIQNVDGILALLTDKMDAELMDAAPKLKVISNYAVGYDNIDVKAATERGIMVTNTPGVLTETTADLAFTLLMTSARRIVESDRFTREGKWKTWGPMLFLGQDIHHATLGIIGLGRIGLEMAKRASGFSMHIIYHDANRNPEAEKKYGIEYAEFDELIKKSDFISLHTPLIPETHHLIGESQFNMMKPNAILINTSRGPVVDQNALYEALKSGKIAGAGLDVFEVEPIASDDKLLTLDNVTIVPHIASASIFTRTKMATMAAENLVAALSGNIPQNLVNPEVLEKLEAGK